MPAGFGFASQLGGGAYDIAYGIAVDGSGNVYSAGSFSGTADFDPGPGTSSLTSFGNADIFVSRLDSAGNFVWARQLGGTGDQEAFDIAVDGSGNVYITGSLRGTADFDPGAGTSYLTSFGSADVLVCKLNSAGDFVWARQLGGTGFEEGYGIAVDGSGNVYTTGRFEYTADFDPGAGASNLVNFSGDFASYDIFISKLDSAGNYVWARQLGGTGSETATAIAVDGAGNVYTTGYFSGTADFDPGAGTSLLTTGGAFVSKLDSAGNYSYARWIGRTGPSGGAEGQDIAVDALGNVFLTGKFEGTVDFDPGPGTSTLTCLGVGFLGSDSFVSKLDSAGDFVWARQLGGTGYEAGYGIAVDGSGNVYTAGRFSGTVDFDPGTGTRNLTSFDSGFGGGDVYVSILDSAGNFVDASQIGGTGVDEAFGIAVDGAGNVCTTGYFAGTADFDPGPGTSNLTSFGSNDAFVSRLLPSASPPPPRPLGTSRGSSPIRASRPIPRAEPLAPAPVTLLLSASSAEPPAAGFPASLIAPDSPAPATPAREPLTLQAPANSAEPEPESSPSPTPAQIARFFQLETAGTSDVPHDSSPWTEELVTVSL